MNTFLRVVCFMVVFWPGGLLAEETSPEMPNSAELLSVLLAAGADGDAFMETVERVFPNHAVDLLSGPDLSDDPVFWTASGHLSGASDPQGWISVQCIQYGPVTFDVLFEHNNASLAVQNVLLASRPEADELETWPQDVQAVFDCAIMFLWPAADFESVFDAALLHADLADSFEEVAGQTLSDAREGHGRVIEARSGRLSDGVLPMHFQMIYQGAGAHFWTRSYVMNDGG